MICTLLTFFCFAWQISPSLSACAQAAVSVSFGSSNASFLRVKEATERQIILPRMRKNSPFRCQKSKKISGEGAQPPPQTQPPVGKGTPPLHTPPPSAPSALRSSHLCNDKYYTFQALHNLTTSTLGVIFHAIANTYFDQYMCQKRRFYL